MSKKYLKGIFVIFAFILFLGQFRDAENFSFYLSSSKIFSSNEQPKIQVETYNYSGTIKFRAYKISNPIEYFENLKDPHNPDIKNLNTSGTYNILQSSFKKLESDIRLASRNLLPAESRKLLKNVFNKEDTVKKSEKNIGKAEDIPAVLADYEIVKEWKEELPKHDEYWNYYTLNVDIKTPGVYLLEGKVGNRKVAYTTIVVSDYALITKNSDKKLLAFVSNKANGKSIKDFSLNFYMDGKIMSDGLKTNETGLLTFEYPKKEKTSETNPEFDSFDYTKYLIMGYTNNQFIISEPYISDYYSTYNKYNVYLYTERPVYRPGQTVYFKGIFRQKAEDGSWTNFDKKFVHIKINDARGSTVYNDSLSTNEFGTVNSSIKLEKEFPLGYYWIETKIDGANYSSGFEVQEYKKPEYKVSIEFNKDYYIKGDQLNAAVKANYYFGNPVANANVEYFIYRNRYYSYFNEDEDISTSDDEEGSYYGQELIFSQSGKLNNEGAFSFNYFTDAQGKYDYIYTIVANVTDESRRVISSSKTIKVMRGNFAININSDKYVYTKDDVINLKIIAQDFKNNAVMTNYEVKICSSTYDKIEKMVNGEKHTEYVRKKILITTLYGATNNSGQGELKYKPDRQGSFEVEVIAKDNRKNEISGSNYIYVSDEKYAEWYEGGSNNIKIIPDKKSYSKNETMKVLFIIPYPNTDVLVTTERDNIYFSAVEHFDGNSKIVDIPIKSSFSPNVYISASLVTNNEFFTQNKEISIPDKDKILNVKINNEKDIFKPGEKGKISIKVTNSQNNPVKNAELSLGIVDESIYDIVKDHTPDIIKQFYSKAPNQVYSSSSLYFSFYGYSREIRKDEYSDLYDVNKDRKLLTARNEGERIGYGDIKGEKVSEPRIRKDFRDMIHWNPVLITDKNGTAETFIQYPDNLTTWRATVKAITKETEVGSSISKVITKKNLIVRAEVPRFFISKDGAKIAVTVHNYTASDKSVFVSLAGSNIKVFGEQQKLFVPKNSFVSVDYNISTLDHYGPAKFTVKAVSGSESDAVELTVPILPHGIERADSKNITILNKSDVKTETFTLNENVNIYTSKLYVSASPSVASSILSSLDDLLDYPYGCVEQTMSRFLPAVIVQNTIKDLGASPTARMQNELPAIIEKSLKRLYSFQHSADGGWGWWKDDQTDPYMTAYVVYGLSLAGNAGNNIDKSSIAKGMWNIKWWIENKADLDNTTKTFLIYSLALANNSEKIFDNNLLFSLLSKIDRQKINNYSKALLALSYNLLGNKSESANIVYDLSNNASYLDNMVFWKGKSWHYNWQDDEIETTAFVLKALISNNAKDSKIEKAINYLLAKRDGNSWNSTKQTSIIILALIDYLKNSNELNTNYTMKVYVNDRFAFEKKMTKENIFAKEEKQEINNSFLKPGENKVRVEKYGDGKLYVTNRLLYFTSEENITPSGTDFSVIRTYYRLRLEQRGEKMVYVKEPVGENVNSGDLIFVKINIKSNINNEYFILEDPIASGYEPIMGKQDYEIADEKEFDSYYGYWNWFYTAKEFHDQKVAFFARNIYKGDYSYSYVIRAQIPGEYHIMPAQAYLMYYPEIRGNSEEKIVRVN
jgi:alpha-2-macroglobulin